LQELFSQMKIDLSEVVSIKEASEMRGVSTQAIYDLIKRGRLTTVKVGGRKLLLRKEVEAFEPNITGRPRKDSAAAKSPQASKAAKRGSPSTTKSAKKKRAR
jgi:excisionase family DNA binding protein